MSHAGATALVREVSPSVSRCELTHLARAPIDFEEAKRQHARYIAALEVLGCRIEWLPPLPDHPDAVFVEDTAVVLDELAVVTRPGAESRRGETASVAEALGKYREVRVMKGPGTLDGGDVLRLGRTLYVGITPRTDAAGRAELAALVEDAGYRVCPVAVHGCLHLKSAVTEVAPSILLANPKWISVADFSSFRVVPVALAEPAAGNALRVGEMVIHAAEFPATRSRLAVAGIPVRQVPASELAKAEGGVTCCSLMLA
ncbi:MAG: dimethylargininase [Gemmatimonadales bacterium]|nr:dimethylargininase [Gemmatimonadales bacterium]